MEATPKRQTQVWQGKAHQYTRIYLLTRGTAYRPPLKDGANVCPIPHVTWFHPPLSAGPRQVLPDTVGHFGSFRACSEQSSPPCLTHPPCLV